MLCAVALMSVSWFRLVWIAGQLRVSGCVFRGGWKHQPAGSSGPLEGGAADGARTWNDPVTSEAVIGPVGVKASVLNCGLHGKARLFRCC